MTNQKITVLGVAATKNTQKYFFLLAAERLGLSAKELGRLPYMEDGVLRERVIVQITSGKKFLMVMGATTSQTSYLGMKIAVNKITTNDFLRKKGLPTTQQIDIRSESDLSVALTRFGKILLKPANARAGKGIFSNIQSLSQAQTIYKNLRKHYPIIIAEKILNGNEYRILVINGSVFAVAQYIPPTIIGDGRHSIHFLIKKENVRRTTARDTHLIKINTALHLNLKELSLTINSVLSNNQSVILHKAAPISNGGFAIDVTENIHPQNKLLAENAAKLMNLDIAGIDIITPAIERPIELTGGAIIEINGGPDLNVHFSVRHGKSRNGAEAVLKDYFNL